MRHQLKLASNSRLNQLAEPLLRPGAMESLFDGVEVKPSVLHGGARRAAPHGRRTPPSRATPACMACAQPCLPA